MKIVLVAASAAAVVLASAPAVVSTEIFGSAGSDTDRRRGPVVVAAAGDISDCRPPDCTAARTASRVLQIDPDVALTLGDSQYESGSYQEFMAQYDRTWGRFKGRTRPSVGNHEYGTPDASGYFRYFGQNAGNPDKGYYSFNRKRWHLVALNTSDGSCRRVACGPESAQVRWLRRDLRQDERECVLAYWHHPPWSTGDHGDNGRVRTLWQVLARRGADVVLNGHDHSYERFARRGADGSASRTGVRQFVVGTGGRELYGFDRPPGALTKKRIGNRHGVLELLLRQNAYGWRFRSAAGPVQDSGGPVSCS